MSALERGLGFYLGQNKTQGARRNAENICSELWKWQAFPGCEQSRWMLGGQMYGSPWHVKQEVMRGVRWQKVWSKMIWKDNCSQDVVNIHLEIYFSKSGTLPKFLYGLQTYICQPSLCIFSIYIFQTWLPYIVFGFRVDGLALLGFCGNIYILRIKEWHWNM